MTDQVKRPQDGQRQDKQDKMQPEKNPSREGFPQDKQDKSYQR